MGSGVMWCFVVLYCAVFNGLRVLCDWCQWSLCAVNLSPVELCFIDACSGLCCVVV